MADEADDFLMGGGVPTAKFANEGDVNKGKVLSKELRQQRDIQTGELKFWSDGNKMMQLRVVIQTDERDDKIEDDDGRRALYISGQMKEAVQQAVKKSAAEKLEIGGELAVKYVSTDKPTRKGYNGKKNYRAKFVAPDPADFLEEDEFDAEDADEVEKPAPRKAAAKKAPAKKVSAKKADPVDEFADEGGLDDESADDGF